MLTTKRKIKIVTLLLVLFFMPEDVFALEVSYPGWIPIGADQTLVELVVTLFQVTLLFSALIAFLAIVYAGIQFILGGSNPGTRAGAKERIKAAIIGLIILGSATLLLGTINPGLIKISDIAVDSLEEPILMSVDIPFPAAPGFKAGSGYSEMLLAQELDKSEEILVDMEADLPTILNNILGLMEYCSPDRCDPGSGTFSRLDGFEDCEPCLEEICTEEECVEEECIEEDLITGECIGGEECVEWECVATECVEWTQCPICVGESCTGDQCFGDPLPPSRKTDAAAAIGRIPAIIDSMRVKIDEIREAQELIDSCNADPALGSLTCSMAYILDENGKGITAGCEDGLDFFCASDETGRIFGKTHIPVDEFVLIQGELLAEFNIIIAAIESATCANTTWECGDGNAWCSPSIITGLCTWAPPTDYAPTFAATPHTKQKKIYQALILLAQQLEQIQQLSPLRIHTANAQVLTCTNGDGTFQPDGTWCRCTTPACLAACSGGCTIGPAFCDTGSCLFDVCAQLYACQGGTCTPPASGAIIEDTCASAAAEGLTCSACAPPPPPPVVRTCSDPDGNNVSIASTCFDSSTGSNPDSCISGFPDEIVEYTCHPTFDICIPNRQFCPAGTNCVAGACVSTAPPPPPSIPPPSTNKNGTGCPDELFEELDKLKEFRDRVQENSTALTRILSAARASGALARSGAGIFLVCQDAWQLANGIADSETYQETGTCLEGITCCPSAATLTSLGSCYNADMYFCN